MKDAGNVVRWQVAKLALVQGLQALSSAFFTCGVVFLGADSSDGMGLALVLMFRTLPTLMVAFVGGFLADRFPRRMLAGTTLGIMAVAYGVAAWAARGTGLGWPLQAIGLCVGFVSAVGSPALFALLPSVAPKDAIVRANGLVRTLRNAGSIVGPLFGAWLAQLFAPSSLFLGSAVFLAIGTALTLSLKTTSGHAGGEASGKESMMVSVRSIPSMFRTYPWLAVGVPFWALFLAVQSGAADVTMPLWVVGSAGQGAWSVMASVTSTGYVCGSLIALRMRNPRHMLSTSVLAGTLAILQIAAVGVFPWVPVWYAASFLAGIGLELSGVFWGSMMQTQVDEAHMGRVSSIDYAVSFGLIPVAYALYGLMSAMAPTVILTVSSVVMIVLSLVAYPICVAVERRQAVRQAAGTESR